MMNIVILDAMNKDIRLLLTNAKAVGTTTRLAIKPINISFPISSFFLILYLQHLVKIANTQHPTKINVVPVIDTGI